jgi:glycerophosphoryl diester phosphodiesterase
MEDINETTTLSDDDQKTGWEDLADAPKDNDNEKLLQRAKLYRKFGKIALASSELEKTPEDSQVEALEEQLKALDLSLERQDEYNIVNHKQINTREALEQELQSGTGIPELDIRFDKDGKPWISHSPRAAARFLVSRHIHKLSSEEIEEKGRRLSLEEGLDIFKKYHEDNPNHRFVLEIKELGASRESHAKLLEGLKTLLEERGLTETAIFATLSPSILKSIHDAFPENSKILNGGIAPIISYDLAKKSEGPNEDKEFAVKIPGVELFFSNSSEVRDHADGYGKQTGYMWTRLPKETIQTLRRMREEGKTGAASLTLVNMFANVLEKVSPKTAEKIRRHYAGQLEQLGVQVQVAISSRNPVTNIQELEEQMPQPGKVYYSNRSPGDYSANLPPKS